jgi:hypothetical protein
MYRYILLILRFFRIEYFINNISFIIIHCRRRGGNFKIESIIQIKWLYSRLKFNISILILIYINSLAWEIIEC